MEESFAHDQPASRTSAPAADAATATRPRRRRPAFDPANQVTSLLKPVSLTMVMVVYLVGTLGNEVEIEGGFQELMVYHEEESDSVGTKAGGVLLNALAMVGMLFVVTTLMLLLYKYRCYRVMYGWLLFSVASLLFTFGGVVLRQLLATYEVPADEPTLLLFLYNVAVVGTLVVFWGSLGFGEDPQLAQQGYLVVISALMAFSATKLPEWTTWGVLGAVSAWDVVAVLTPRGPLKLLVEEAEKREEAIPGLVYSGDDIKLGLGDFIFYSILVGRASLTDGATAVSCAVAVLAGLCSTLALLPVFEQALPALPISIVLGAAFYFCMTLLVGPFTSFVAAHSLFI